MITTGSATLFAADYHFRYLDEGGHNGALNSYGRDFQQSPELAYFAWEQRLLQNGVRVGKSTLANDIDDFWAAQRRRFSGNPPAKSIVPPSQVKLPVQAKGPVVCPAPNNFRPPASRHTLSRVNQRTVAKDLNSVVGPGVDVAGDVRLINQGHATKVGETYVVNGRTYGVHDGTLFPMSGPGVHQLNRPAFKALGVFNQFGDTAQARQILENMARTNPALNQEAIDAALRAWRAGGGA